MKNLKLRKGKVAIMSVAMFILMFSLLFSAIIPEYSEKVTKNEPNLLLQDVQASADPSSFLSVWNTNLTSSGSSGANQVKLPLESGGIYDFTVYWGDTNSSTITNWDQTEVTHNYSSTGVYEVNITGTIVGWRFNNEGDKLKLIEISQWGNLNLGNSDSYFQGCINLNLTTTDILNLTGTTNLYSTFSSCTTLGSSGNLGGWNVSRVTDMSFMFSGANRFNQYIGGWDVSSVNNMRFMFSGAKAFNQNIGDWNVSSVTNMGNMFFRANEFNQDIGLWNVSSVNSMVSMFSETNRFNQNINGWDVSSVTSMVSMFFGARGFNQDIGGWNVSSVTDMRYMFFEATRFNQNINGWDVSSVTSMKYMFYFVETFNQDISEWNVSRVTDMRSIFSWARVFNQDISEWNVSRVTDMSSMFYGAKAFNQDIGKWNVSKVTDMGYMFSEANIFNQNISGWDVSSVTNMYGMFFRGRAFNQDIGGWNVSSVNSMVSMFSGASTFNQDIGGWNVSRVNDMENMFEYVSMTFENYDSLLIGWANLSLQSSTSFSAGNSKYSSAAAISRQYIIDTYGWTIDDDGLIVPTNPPVLITSNHSIIYNNITIQWNAVDGADNYNIYVEGLFNETTTTIEQKVMLWVNGTYTIAVTAVNALGESELSNEIIIIVEIPPEEGELPSGDTPTIPGYNFVLIPTILLGLVILTVKIRKMKNQLLKIES